MHTIYFDYNATTTPDPAVREAMLPFLGEVFGNPSSVHHVGRRARALLDDARDRVASVFACRPAEVVFTSGGTESVNLAIFGTARLLRNRGRHIITSAVEHHAVLHACQYLARTEGFELSVLPCDSEGRIHVDTLQRALRPDTILVSIQAANNETGTLQPVAELGAACRARSVAFHTDAVQWFGKQPFASIHQFNADLVTVCAHKFHGPKGAGALFIRSPLHPDPILFGGGHENERRAGTENLAAIVGLCEVIERFVREPVFPPAQLEPLTRTLIAGLAACPGVHFRGAATARLANTASFTVEGCDSIALLAGLDLEGVCASSGSACSSGSLEPSHVMTAMGVGASEANSLVRFSLGRESTTAEVDRVLAVFPTVVARIRSAAQKSDQQHRPQPAHSL
ncbi:MAG: cysteine desulfurase [Verrucomicrobia bacterium]|nr:cysteine desulfurase [Verrucomicrobiota bacterium]